MSMHKTYLAFVIGICLCSGSANAQSTIDHFGVGQTATAEEMAKYFSIPPSGDGLPAWERNGKNRCEAFC